MKMDKQGIYKLIAAITGIVLLFAIAVYATMPKAPRIALSETNFEAGNIDPAKGVWSGTFLIKNKGSARLLIEGLTTSCGCTKAKAAEDAIEPGQETELKVTYDPSTHPGLTGRIERIVYISSNDPENPEAELKITGNVLPLEIAK